MLQCWRRTGHLPPVFSSPPRGIWQLKSPHLREFAIRGKKSANARESAGGAWAQVELTGALLTELKIVQKTHIKYENGAPCDWKSAKTS